MLKWLFRFWLKIFQPKPIVETYFSEVYFVKEFPDTLKCRTIYIEGDINQKQYWYIGFICPCGCNLEYKLNLISDTRPLWKFEIDKQNQISVFPSVWRTTDCRSHFFIKENDIIWVDDRFS